MRSVVDRNVVMQYMTLESVIIQLIEKKIIIWVTVCVCVCVVVVGVKPGRKFPL